MWSKPRYCSHWYREVTKTCNNTVASHAPQMNASLRTHAGYHMLCSRCNANAFHHCKNTVCPPAFVNAGWRTFAMRLQEIMCFLDTPHTTSKLYFNLPLEKYVSKAMCIPGLHVTQGPPWLSRTSCLAAGSSWPSVPLHPRQGRAPSEA